MIPRRVRAIFFDWDLTLCAIGGTAVSAERLEQQFRLIGLNHSLSYIQAAVACRRARLHQHRMQGALKPQTKREILGYYRQLLELLRDPHDSHTTAQALYAAFSELEFQLYPNAGKLLAALARDGYCLGIISNTSSAARPKILGQVQTWIPDRHIVLSEDYGIHKPARTLFLRAAMRVACAPEECLYVGDNLTVDAVGAIQNGGFAHAMWLNREPHPEQFKQSIPNGITAIESLDDLLSRLPK